MRSFQLVHSVLRAVFTGSLVIAGSVSLAQPGCPLKAPDARIKHVIYVQFDNVHLTRDAANVPSDLEQIPNLLNFIKSNGYLDSNHHAVLISHTADDIMTSITGVYGDRHGISVANSYGVFRPDGSVAFPSSFAYWTDLVSDIDPTTQDPAFSMVNETGQNTSAPWVAFTREGCDVGVFSLTNMIIERPSFDVPKIFGAGSPEANEDSDHQIADFEGVGVHCALGSPLCSQASHAVDDLLPDEPDGYNGFKALFGAKYLALAVGGPLKDLDGNVIKNADSGLVGFTGFDPLATQSLGYVATMQEKGIPVTYAYIADAHDDHVDDVAFGPGQAGYVAQLASYNKAFGQFFERLKKDGITADNTLFIFTADEGDHFAGGPPLPRDCDGIHTPCAYPRIGELDLNLNGLVAAKTGNNTPFSIRFDDAPNVYINGNPSPDDPSTRQLEQNLAGLTVLNPVTHKTDNLTVALADFTEMGLLHMITNDPARTPTFTMFGDADYFFESFGSTTPVEDPGFAWNHGGIQTEVGTTWLGLIGPGVRRGNSDEADDAAAIRFSDETDIRPTMLSLLGLHDDYIHDGRVLAEAIQPSVLPDSLTDDYSTFLFLSRLYKQLNAPFGELSQKSLVVSTAALASNTPGDAKYLALDGKLLDWWLERDALADRIRAILEGVTFRNEPIDQGEATQLLHQGETLINQVAACAANPTACAH
jgi:hypothetical protein